MYLIFEITIINNNYIIKYVFHSFQMKSLNDTDYDCIKKVDHWLRKFVKLKKLQIDRNLKNCIKRY